MENTSYDDLYRKYSGVTPSKTTFASKIKKLLFSPHEFFEKVKMESGIGSAFKFYLIFLLIFSVLYSILLSFLPTQIPSGFQPLSGTTPFGIIISCISLFIGGVISVFIGGLWLHLWVYILGGRKGLTQTLKTTMYGSVPSLLFGWISPIPLILFAGNIGSYGFIGSIILPIILQFAFAIWSFILDIIGIKILHEISTGRAVLSVLIPTIIIPLIIALVIGGLVYNFLAGSFVTKTSKLISISSPPTCIDGSISLVLTNIGTQSIDVSELTFYIENEEVTPSCTGIIAPGSSKVCTIGSGLTGAKTGEVKGPSNQESFFVICQ